MNGFGTDEQGSPLDACTLVTDDLLLDQLGRDEPVSDPHDVATMLAQWRAILPDHAEGDEHLFVVPPPPPSRSPSPAMPSARRLRRTTRRVLAGTTAALLAFGGATLTAAHVGPHSPLWPITQLVYPEHADSVSAADAAARMIGAARTAVEQGHFVEAVRMLDVATVLTARVRESDGAGRMRADIAQLRGLIPAAEFGPAVSEAPASVPPGEGRAVPVEPQVSEPQTGPAEPREPTRTTEAPSRMAPVPASPSDGARPGSNVSLPPPVIPTPAAPLPTTAIRPDVLGPDVPLPA